MDQNFAPESPAAPPSAFIAVLIIGGIVVVVAGFVTLASMLGIKPIYAGLLFSLYWSGIRLARLPEFVPALIGALAGLLNAWALQVGPVLYGTVGYALALTVIAVAIFALLRGQLPWLFNLSYMLFLTVFTIPPIVAAADFPGSLAAVVMGAAYFGALMVLLARFGPKTAAA